MRNDKNPWDLIAKKYDESFGDEGDYSHKYVIYPAILELLGDVKGKRILDMGCGTGVFARKLARLGADIMGVDSSKEMLLFAKKRNHIGDDKYLEWDAKDSLTEFEEYFNIVVQVMLLHSVDDLCVEKIIDNTYKILRDGGEVITVIPHPFFVKDFKSLQADSRDYYLTTQKAQFVWKQFNNNGMAPTDFFLRSLQFYTDSFLNKGFKLSRIIEPPIIDSKESFEARPHIFGFRREIPGFMLLKFVK